MNAIEILEQAVNLLRAQPAALLVYLTGVAPFAVALLFFLDDMNRSPFAFDHLAAASASLAALYVWKNAWQAMFARRLYRALSPDQPPLPVLKTIFVQATLQPIGLAMALPFPWLVAFFRNAALTTALGWPRPLRAARRQAMLATSQNWGILALTTFAGLLLFVNLLIVIVMAPQLARSFLGVEGEWTRLGMRILNLSTAAVAATLAWLVVDPLLDAVYVLRVFYGASLVTGEDLKAALRRLTVAALIVLALAPGRANAQVQEQQLDQSIDQVIHSREFTWRAPRPPGAEPQGKWVGWIRGAEDLLARGWDTLMRALRHWLEPAPSLEKGGSDSPVTRRELQGLIAIVVAIALAAAFVFFTRRRPETVAATPVTVAGTVDLRDESVTADQMGEGGWLQLAEEWLAKGDCRLALRALYLAGLKYLGERQVVTIHRAKSGLDYAREVARRTRAQPQIAPAFANNLAIFERGWYGVRAVDRETVEKFAAGLTEIRREMERA